MAKDIKKLRPQKVWLLEQIEQSDGFLTCQYCRGTFPTDGKDSRGYYVFTVDHAVPRAKGGKDTPENFRLACRLCNWEKGTLSESEYLTIRRYRENPEQSRAVEVLDILLRNLSSRSQHIIERYQEGLHVL